MFESFGTAFDALGYLGGGLVVTLELVALSLLLGFVLGLILTIAQVYGAAPFRGFVHVYVWFFRGLPNLVLCSCSISRSSR
jgi:amine acid ABC transporter, permease protein, 3-TM region, His/Glu/Gln/Arg/opine family